MMKREEVIKEVVKTSTKEESDYDYLTGSGLITVWKNINHVKGPRIDMASTEYMTEDIFVGQDSKSLIQNLDKFLARNRSHIKGLSNYSLDK